MAGRSAYHHGDLAAATVEEALRLIAAEGEARFSLRALADRLGVAHRALYNHFADREALLAAVAARGFGQMADALTAATEPAAFLAAYVRFARGNPGLYEVMTERHHAQINATPSLRSAVDRVIAVALAVLATPDADEDTRRREVMRVWMLAHGAIGLQRAGMLRLRSEADFVDEVLRIAGVVPPQENAR